MENYIIIGMRKENEDMELLCMVGCFLNVIGVAIGEILNGVVKGSMVLFEIAKNK